MTTYTAAWLYLDFVHGSSVPTKWELKQLVIATTVLKAAGINALDIDALAKAAS